MTLGTTSAKFLCGYCHAEYDTPEEVRECAVQRHGQKRTTSANDLVERVARALADNNEIGLSADSPVVTPDSQPNTVPYWTEFVGQAKIAIEAIQPADTITRLKAALNEIAGMDYGRAITMRRIAREALGMSVGGE